MSIKYDGDFTLPKANGQRLLTYPFDGDNNSFYFTQTFMQRFDHFEALPLDTPDTEFLDAFLVKETPLLDLGAGIAQWSRIYARIPSARQEMESYAYIVPGITAEEVVVARFIDSATNIGNQTRITTTSSHSINVDDIIVIVYFAQDPFSGLSFRRQVSRVVLAVPAADVVDVDIIRDVGTITWDSLFPYLFGREPFTRVVPSYITFDYFLPGVSAGVDTFNDIEIFQPTIIIDNTGNVTDSYSDTSVPSVDDYRASVAARESIVAEPSIVRRWMGNIYERSTRYVTAI